MLPSLLELPEDVVVPLGELVVVVVVVWSPRGHATVPDKQVSGHVVTSKAKQVDSRVQKPSTESYVQY